LEDTSLTYDEVGNPTEIRDWREPSEWPAGSKPVTKKVIYDDLYRATRIDYQYSTDSGTDSWKSPFEQENTESDDTRDKRRAKPVPQLQFTNRPLSQRYEYDWLGNVTESDDDAHGIWDRSLGDQKHENSGKPYQFTSASNSSQKGSGQGHAGTVVAKYDDAGNMTRLGVVRPSGACLPGSSPCTQEYVYNWDEVGRLVRARRYDSYSSSVDINAATPGGTLAIDLRHRYDASDNRVIKRDYASDTAKQRHSLYVFGSFEVRRTTYLNNAYTVDQLSAVPYAMANGVRLARLHYGNQDEPRVSGVSSTVTAPGFTATVPQVHVLLELGDHLGSTSTVLDKATSELVEKASYLAYGAKESDYRTERWEGFREDYGFTGKEEDVEVGLVYFGKRFLSPQLGRWVSADPLAVHAPGEADLNLYAYVEGGVLATIDPVGLLKISIDWEAFKPKNVIKTFSGVAEGVKQTGAELKEVVTHPIATAGRVKDAVVTSYNNGGVVGVAKDFTIRPVTEAYAAAKSAEARGDYAEAGKQTWNAALAIVGLVEGGRAVIKTGTKIGSKLAQRMSTTPKAPTSLPAEGCVGEACVAGGPKGTIGCFVTGTLVWTSDGLVPIETIKEGDLVLTSPDGGWKSPIVARVGKAYKRVVDVTLVLTFSDLDGEVINVETTTEHPFWSEDIGWVHAIELAVGERVWSVGHGWVELTHRAFRYARVPVYNLLVENEHTYFVGAFGAWVHNQECGENAKNSIPESADGDTTTGKPKAKDRRNDAQRRSNEQKHGDAEYEEPASEDYAKYKAKQLEKSAGRDARRSGHDSKDAGEGDRSKRTLDEDYGKK
jgi:RHS repeat-associated protein